MAASSYLANLLSITHTHVRLKHLMPHKRFTYKVGLRCLCFCYIANIQIFFEKTKSLNIF